MRQINLLPQEVIAQRARMRTIPALFLAVVIAVIAVIAPWWMLRGVEASLDEQITTRRDTLGITQKDSAVTDAELDSSQTDILTVKITALNQLAKREVVWAEAFNVVEDLLPKDISLTSYTITTNSAEVTYTLVGEAPSNVSFATFIESLRTNEKVGKVLVEGFVFSPTKLNVAFNIRIASPIATVQYSQIKK